MSRPGRGEVWRVLGAPSEQVGSVNEPRPMREGDVRFNEKWVYRNREGRIERIVLWNRYDLVGVFRVDEAGLHPESLPAA
jgi:hypothetical protein